MQTFPIAVLVLLVTSLSNSDNSGVCEQACADVCPNSCNSPSERGFCDLSIGRCVCFGNWGGNDCGTLNGDNDVPAPHISTAMEDIEATIDAFENAVTLLAEDVEEMFSGSAAMYLDESSNISFYHGKTSVTYNEALRACHELDGDLATITSEDENKIIKKLVDGSKVWIGLNDIEKEGSFRWIDGVKSGKRYENFNDDRDEPDNESNDGKENADCVVMKKAGRWSDEDCDDPHGYVCRIDEISYYNYCDADTPKNSFCDPRFGNMDECECSGRRISKEEIAIRTPDVQECRMREVNLILSSLNPLIETYKELSTDVPDISLMYFGSSAGILHQYPAYNHGSGTCASYDPRVRPWYIATSSIGPRNIVLILDGSVSMASKDRIETLWKVAETIVNGVSFYDFFSVVAFGESTTTFGNSTLLPGSLRNKELAIEWIYEIYAAGSSNVKNGFAKAFEILEDNVYDVSCRSSVLLLTDGAHSGTNPSNFVKSWMDDHSDTDLFVFTVGREPSEDLPKQLVDENHGIYTEISPSADVLSSLNSYYQYYTVGISDKSQTVRWTEPYEGFSGLGPLITAGKLVYDRSFNPPRFLGVVAIDLAACGLYEVYSANDIFEVLAARNAVCLDWSLDANDIEEIDNLTTACDGCISVLRSGDIGVCSFVMILTILVQVWA